MIPPPLGIHAVDSSGAYHVCWMGQMINRRRHWCRTNQSTLSRHPAEAKASARFQEVVG